MLPNNNPPSSSNNPPAPPKPDDKKEEKFDAVKTAAEIQKKAQKIDQSTVRELLSARELNRNSPISKKIDALETEYLTKLKEVQTDATVGAVEEKKIKEAFTHIKQQQKEAVKKMCQEGKSEEKNFALDDKSLTAANDALKNAAGGDVAKQKLADDFKTSSEATAKKIPTDNYEAEMKHVDERLKRRVDSMHPLKLAVEHRRLSEGGKIFRLIFPVSEEDDQRADLARDAKRQDDDLDAKLSVSKTEDEVLPEKLKFFKKMRKRFEDLLKAKQQSTWRLDGSPYVIVVGGDGVARIHLSSDEIQRRRAKWKHEGFDNRGFDIVDPLNDLVEYAKMQRELMDFLSEMDVHGTRAFTITFPSIKNGVLSSAILERRVAAIEGMILAAKEGGYSISISPETEKELMHIPPKYKWYGSKIFGLGVEKSSEERLQEIRKAIKESNGVYGEEINREKKLTELQDDTKKLDAQLKQSKAESQEDLKLDQAIKDELARAVPPAVDVAVGGSAPVVSKDAAVETVVQREIDKVEKEYVSNVKRVEELTNQQVNLLNEMIEKKGAARAERDADLIDNQIFDMRSMIKSLQVMSADKRIAGIEKAIETMTDEPKKTALKTKLDKMKQTFEAQQKESLKVESVVDKLSEKLKAARQTYKQQSRL